MLRSTFLALAAAAAVSTAMTPLAFAQAIPATVDAPVEITFYNYNLASAGLGADGTRELIAEFEALNPNIKVNAVGVPSPEMTSRIQADIAANRGPDVAQVVFDGLAFVADNLGAHALEDLVPSAELSAHFDGMSANGLQLGVIGDKTWALAYTFSTPVLFYNADLFRAAGLDPDASPATWAEVEAAGLAIQEKTDARGFDGGIIGAAAGPFDWLLQSVILSNGGRVLSEDRKTLTFAEPAAVEAVQMLRGLKDKGLFENPGGGIEGMTSGTLGMLLNTSALQATLIAGAKDKFELRAASMPGFGDKAAVPTNSGSGLVILSADPLKQRASWELMKFLTSERGYTIITSKIGYLPLRPAIIEDPEFLGEWVKANPMVRPNLAQLERIQPWTAFPGQNFRQIQKTMMEAMEMAVFGEADVASTLKAAQDQAQALMPNDL